MSGTDLDSFAGDPEAELLRMNLALAVPLRIAQYQRERRSAEWLMTHAREVWGVKAAARHEALLYRSKPSVKNGADLPGTAQVFNWFAEAVACAALVAEGGIKILGLHFDAELSA
jgi:hypothetical protein